MKLPTFSGDNDVLQFLEDLELYVTATNVREAVAHCCFTFALKGKVLLWYKAFGKYLEPKAEESKYAAIRRKLIETFKPLDDEWEEDSIDAVNGQMSVPVLTYNEDENSKASQCSTEQLKSENAATEESASTEWESKRGLKRKTTEFQSDVAKKRAKIIEIPVSLPAEVEGRTETSMERATASRQISPAPKVVEAEPPQEKLFKKHGLFSVKEEPTAERIDSVESTVYRGVHQAATNAEQKIIWKQEVKSDRQILSNGPILRARWRERPPRKRIRRSPQQGRIIHDENYPHPPSSLQSR